MLGANAIQKFSGIQRSFYSKIFPILIVLISFALFDNIVNDGFFINDLILDEAQNCHFHAQFFGNYTRNHDSRCIHQEHQGIIENLKATETFCCADRRRCFGSGIFVFEVGDRAQLIDDGGFADVGSAAGHQPKAYLLVFMPIVFLEKGQHFPHIIVFLRADCEALESIVIVILDNLISLGCVAQIIFVENDYLFFLVLLNYQVEFRITAAVWDPCISNLYEDIYLVAILFDLPQGLLHVSWEPVYMVLQRIYHLHFEID